jgi:hypothetical protein
MLNTSGPDLFDRDVDALALLLGDELRDQHVLGERRAGAVLAAFDRVRADRQLDLLGVGVAVRVLVAAVGVGRAEAAGEQREGCGAEYCRCVQPQ